MADKQQVQGLRLKGETQWLRNSAGEAYHAWEWSPVQLANVARAHGVAVDQLEAAPMGWSLEEVREAQAKVASRSKLVLYMGDRIAPTEPTPGEEREPLCTCPLGERDPDCAWHNWHEAHERGEAPHWRMR